MAGINGYPGFITDFPRGHTKKFVIEMTRDVQDPEDPDNEDATIEEPIDLTGCKFYVTFDEDLDTDTAPLIEVEIDPPTDPLNGRTTGVITDTQSFGLEGGNKLYYSVRFINMDGETFVIDMGRIKILNAVSHRIE